MAVMAGAVAVQPPGLPIGPTTVISGQATGRPQVSGRVRDVAIVGSDGASDVMPSGVDGVLQPNDMIDQGPNLRGSIVPGGWDWQLRRADACTVIKADYMLRTDDGTIINVVNTGVACSGPDGKRLPIRTSPVFEAPLGKYEWLSRSAFVGTLDGTKINGKPAVRIRFFRVR